MKADATSDPAGSCSRLATLVLAHSATADHACGGTTAPAMAGATKPATKEPASRYRRAAVRARPGHRPRPAAAAVRMLGGADTAQGYAGPLRRRLDGRGVRNGW